MVSRITTVLPFLAFTHAEKLALAYHCLPSDVSLSKEELDTTPAALALAWVAKNTNTGTVILGATSPEQVLENLKALDVLPKLTPEVLQKIEDILGNKPEPLPAYNRPALDAAVATRRFGAW